MKVMKISVAEENFFLTEECKPEKQVSIGKSEYKALAGLSPNGIFLFDGERIFEVNQAFSRITGIHPGVFKTITLKDIIDTESFTLIQPKMSDCMSGHIKSFDEHVKVITASSGTFSQCRLHVTVSRKNKDFIFFVGLLEPTLSESREYEGLLKGFSEETILSNNSSLHQRKTLELPGGGQSDASGAIKTLTGAIFSNREHDVLRLSCQGLPIKIIADRLCITHKTVEKHRSSLMEKTGAKNIVELFLYALKNDLVALPG